MKEALDGDSSEAIAVKQAGKQGFGRSQEADDPQSEVEESGATRTAVQAPEKVQRVEPDDDPLSKMRASKARAGNAEQTVEVAPTVPTQAPNQSSAVNAHDNLMVQSSTMKSDEIRTLLAGVRMQALATTLSSPDWTADRNAARDLVGTQMNSSSRTLA
jgi:hypothetical protein